MTGENYLCGYTISHSVVWTSTVGVAGRPVYGVGRRDTKTFGSPGTATATETAAKDVPLLERRFLYLCWRGRGHSQSDEQPNKDGTETHSDC